MKYEITKEQLRSITDPKVKEMFPEAFKVELEVGKWYKSNLGNLVFNNGKFGSDETYGFGYGDKSYLDKMSFNIKITWQPATNQEVSDALINEAKKRGYEKRGNYKYYDTNCLYLAFYCIFDNGIWAEIIEPTFEYLEEVEVSEYKDFLCSEVMRYGCKHVKGYYICFTKNDCAITVKYIKKIKP